MNIDKSVLDSIIAIESNDITKENGNMSSETVAGIMAKLASETAKKYALDYLVSKEFSEAHQKGAIHIHDLDYYATKSTTCVQYDLDELYTGGFTMRDGTIREPNSISTALLIATVVFQSNQNTQHGGQSIPAFDFFMAPYVLKSFKKHLIHALITRNKVSTYDGHIREVVSKLHTIDKSKLNLLELAEELHLAFVGDLDKSWDVAFELTRKETYQAMEGFIHNLNTMHSRGGNQVTFSSINYGTDTSTEGRMIIRELLKATQAGLGKGETPVFPIQIFKLKRGVNYDMDDPNYDLLELAVETTSKRLFPNFVNLDASFNIHEGWDVTDPKRWMKEVATMGCRTRVFENINGDKTSVGRGNLSFTSLNLPRAAMEAKRHFGYQPGDKIEPGYINQVAKFFQSIVTQRTRLAAEQLHERLNWQKQAQAKQFSFMAQNNIWKGMGDKKPGVFVGDTLESGTLGIGFVGGSEAMFAIFGETHAKSIDAYLLLTDTLIKMNEVVEFYKDLYKHNYSVLATPAESLAGTFLRKDRLEFGTVEGITDEDYYTNSYHVSVKEEVSINTKLTLEAPFHELTKGGHISYIELDGEAKKNPSVLMKIVKQAHDLNMGYISINHPVDQCRECGLETIIDHECPKCGSKDISRMRRITGYLTGSLETWNAGKRAEEKNRFKHSTKGDK